MGHHHTFLLLPVLSLGLLLLVPWPIALPAWLAITLGSGLAFRRAIQALAAPVTTGREGMLGGTVRVLGPAGAGWQVRHGGEVWSALSPDALRPGDSARIVNIQGLKLVVVQDDPQAPPARRALADARRATVAALARLEGRISALAAEADQREAAARSALPAGEAAARDYLRQRQALLAAQARLEQEAAALRAELARLQALERSDIPG